MLKYYLLLLLIFSFVGCSKPDPNPELKDPIYSDINSEISALTQQIESEKNQLKNHTQELEEAPPQTGKVKFALKRQSESRFRINSLEQEKKYVELKLASRKRFARESYNKAFNNKTAWPDPKEWESYSAEKRLRNAKKEWDVKQRIKEAQIEMMPSKPKGHGEH